MSDTLLPPPFAALQPFAEDWNLSTFPERHAQRRRLGIERMRAFYAAIVPLLPQLQDRLRTAGNRLEGTDRTLANLVLALAHVSLAVEVLGDKEGEHARLVKDMQISAR